MLLALTVPFCCCNLHAWLERCSSCVTPAGDQLSALNDVGGGVDGDVCHLSEQRTDSCDHHPRGDSTQRPPHDHDCHCGQHDAKVAGGKPVSLELALPALVAILDRATDLGYENQWCRTAAIGRAAFQARPPTSLLLQHCALTV